MAFVTIGEEYTNISDSLTGYGSVSYVYEIDQYEITNSQWSVFVSAVGAPTGNDDAYNSSSFFTNANQPVNNVSWYEAAQYCNWRTSGNKLLGAYIFNNGFFSSIDRESAIGTYGTIYVIPTLNEWYKAAYYSIANSCYFLFANGSNNPPDTSQTNYNTYTAPWDVGSGTIEQNGTYDMMGNVWEWTETYVGLGNANRGIRGGSYNKPFVLPSPPPPSNLTDYIVDPTGYINICSRRYAGLAPHKELPDIGFRIVKL